MRQMGYSMNRYDLLQSIDEAFDELTSFSNTISSDVYNAPDIRGLLIQANQHISRIKNTISDIDRAIAVAEFNLEKEYSHEHS